MNVRKLALAALRCSVMLATAAPAFADWDWQRHERQEWRERQQWRERQAWREQEWRDNQAREQPHGFPFVSPSRNNIPPPLYSPGPAYRR